jgi:hypothetical protein
MRKSTATRKPLPSDLANLLAAVAHAVGDLWTIQVRLASSLGSRELDGRTLVEMARKAAAELAPLGERLARIVETLPVAAAVSLKEAMNPVAVARSCIECVLADRLRPAVADLKAASRRPPDRADLECVLADSLLPAIEDLTYLLLLGGPSYDDIAQAL